MSTRRNINSTPQVKTINGQRWICERINISGDVAFGSFDFIDNADGRAWKKIRPWTSEDYKYGISGESQDKDDKNPDKK